MRRIHQNLKFLSDDEVLEIHDTSLKILEEIGCYVPHDRILELLDKKGARVDFKGKIARFEKKYVEEVIKKAPKSFEVVPAYFENRFKVGDGVLKLWMNFTQDMCDWVTHKRRLCTFEDIMKGIILGNELPFIGTNNVIAAPEGIPSEIVDIYCWNILYTYSRKASNSWIYNLNSARFILEMAIVMAGSEEELKKKKNLMYFAESISPLRWGKYTLDIMSLYSKYEIPIFLGPILTSGASGPVTLAGSLALANAEILSGIVILNALNEKQPIIYPVLTTPVNMRTAMISYGAPEMALLSAAAVQIANFYGFPSSGNVHLSDSNLADFQYGYEKAATFSLALAAGMEMWGIIGYSAAGHMGTNPGLSSFEGLVLDNECFGYMSRILDGIDVNKDTLAYEVIKETGIGGNFLAHPHTARHFRKELWDPGIFVRQSYSDWQATGETNVVDKTIFRTDEIIKKNWPCEQAIDTATKKELDKILETAKKELLK